MPIALARGEGRAAFCALSIAAALAGCATGTGVREGALQLRRPVLLTTDTGADMDDQWVLAHLALSPELDLRGVVTTHTGSHPILPPPAAESSARVANEVLDRLPLRERPQVIAGSNLPLRSQAEANPGAGVEFILETSRRFDRNRRLTVLVIGAATDLASALLIDPALAERIEVVSMAFNGWPEGDDLFNVKNDVHAWQVLLASGAPLVVGDAAVTRRELRQTRESARRLFASAGEPGRYLAGLLVRWLDEHRDLAQDLAGERDAWPVWDEVTVAHLLGLTRSEVHPRPRLRDDLHFEHPAAGGAAQPAVTWVTEIDAERLWDDFRCKVEKVVGECGGR
jgi:inosine-uridine nucleoside N-ribohydrolase